MYLLSEGWMRQVLEIAKNLAVTSEGFEDVVQEGNMALFCGLQSYAEPERERLLKASQKLSKLP